MAKARPKKGGKVYKSGYREPEGGCNGKTRLPIPPEWVHPEDGRSKAEVIEAVVARVGRMPLALACQAEGIHLNTFRRWMEGEEPLARSLRARIDRARAIYMGNRLALLESPDVTNAQVKAVQFLGNVHYPEHFARKDRVEHDHKHDVKGGLAALVKRAANDESIELPTRVRDAEVVSTKRLTKTEDSAAHASDADNDTTSQDESE